MSHCWQRRRAAVAPEDVLAVPEAETALDHFGARYYRNVWGRFTSVDPYLSPAALTDPQRWNRYSYALNSPMSLVDTSGLDPKEPESTLYEDGERFTRDQIAVLPRGPVEVTELNPLERAVLEMLLAGEQAVLGLLRAQAEVAEVISREYTRVGFYCNFQIPDGAAPFDANLDFEVGGVGAEVDGLERGIGFILFVVKGKLDFLEAFTFDEPWPDSMGVFKLSYTPERAQYQLPQV